MKLSVIIVSYKVPYFLEQCLLSVQKAAQEVETEIIVIDNKSEDGTVALIQEKFPRVRLIANTQNTGFATANNQGIAIAEGEYILFLNPDTIVREDTFVKIITFMESTPNAGGLGVKMIDGTGVFLPESKRGFPSPTVAFYKTFGLSSIFPKSKRFNQYHLGYLDPNQNHKVDVLSGAFMLMPRQVLEKIGYWDEAFFMYGEDIDLSYRIIKAGYQNYYYADTTIIHYKGESTKKGSLNYVKTFYEAMIIFAKKHFQGSKASLFVFMLQMAIYFRAFLTIFSSFFKQISLFTFDAILVYGGLVAIKNIWEVIRFDDPFYYDLDTRLVYFNFPLYVLIWLFCTYLRGGYDRLARHRHLITGIGLGTILIAAIYAFFPQELRFSRMLILLGSLWAILVLYSTRAIQSFVQTGSFLWSKTPQSRLIIVGEEAESKRVLHLLYQAHIFVNFVGRVSPSSALTKGNQLGHINQLTKWVEIYQANEIIFCAKDINFEIIIKAMTQLGKNITYKIVAPHSNYIIGSNSKNTAGDLYTTDINFQIANSIKQRNKRVLDIIYSLIFLLLLPVIFWLVECRWGFLKNIVAVLRGQKTWIGYYPLTANQSLPPLKNSVLNPIDRLTTPTNETEIIHKINFFYAKDYCTKLDWDILLKAWSKLGRTALINPKRTEK